MELIPHTEADSLSTNGLQGGEAQNDRLHLPCQCRTTLARRTSHSL